MKWHQPSVVKKVLSKEILRPIFKCCEVAFTIPHLYTHTHIHIKLMIFVPRPAFIVIINLWYMSFKTIFFTSLCNEKQFCCCCFFFMQFWNITPWEYIISHFWIIPNFRPKIHVWWLIYESVSSKLWTARVCAISFFIKTIQIELLE